MRSLAVINAIYKAHPLPQCETIVDLTASNDTRSYDNSTVCGELLLDSESCGQYFQRSGTDCVPCPCFQKCGADVICVHFVLFQTCGTDVIRVHKTAPKT